MCILKRKVALIQAIQIRRDFRMPFRKTHQLPREDYTMLGAGTQGVLIHHTKNSRRVSTLIPTAIVVRISAHKQHKVTRVNNWLATLSR